MKKSIVVVLLAIIFLSTNGFLCKNWEKKIIEKNTQEIEAYSDILHEYDIVNNYGNAGTGHVSLISKTDEFTERLYPYRIDGDFINYNVQKIVVLEYSSEASPKIFNVSIGEDYGKDAFLAKYCKFKLDSYILSIYFQALKKQDRRLEGYDFSTGKGN